jgi:NAD(P)-dependent dehydrogenase (short-subunit alcohol dehydrogenase family)
MSDTSVVVVTGASRGIGAAVAERFAAAGFQLALCDRVPPLVGVLDAAAQSSGHRPLFVEGDLGQPSIARASMEQVVAGFGRIDVLVTCAGIHRFGPSEAVDLEVWAQVIDVNLTGTFACIQAVLPTMLDQGAGRIITISSELGLAGMAEYAAYCASKGGVIALTKALAREYVSRGILINSVAPGPVLTDLLMDSPEYESDATPDVPIGRYGRPDEIAEVVFSLAGDAGSFMVGQVISPNGGAVM